MKPKKRKASKSVGTFTTGNPIYFRYDDHEPLSCKEVDTILRFHRLDRSAFMDWMIGQTGPVLADGSFGTYWYDLNRYIRWKEKNIKPIFD